MTFNALFLNVIILTAVLPRVMTAWLHVWNLNDFLFYFFGQAQIGSFVTCIFLKISKSCWPFLYLDVLGM